MECGAHVKPCPWHTMCWTMTVPAPSGHRSTHISEGTRHVSSRRRLNCWEYQGCERGPGGRRWQSGNACPVGQAQALDGANGGVNAGRACWVITGTVCDGKKSGTYQQKIHECQKCSFYARVHVEEALGIESAEALVERYCRG